MLLAPHILIIVLATSSYERSGAATVQAEFSSSSACTQAGNALIRQAQERKNYILTWGCFPKHIN